MTLRKLLFERNIKQVELVKALGVDPARISMQINGVRNLPERHLVQLAEYLAITKEQLLKAISKERGRK